MILFWSVFLGILQGLTEFLPISSSGHLAVFPYIFKFEDPGLQFGIALHAGTFFAILIALKDDWIGIVKSYFVKKDPFYQKLVLFLVLTSIPGALAGYFLEESAATIFRNPLLIAATLIAFGFLLMIVDRKVKKEENIEKMDGRNAFLIGLAQACAIVPGVSRSGATMTAARALGFSREASARYSFLAALPIIFGASVFGLRDVELSTLFSATWMAGFFAALISSFVAIKFLLYYLKKNNFNIFFYYRLFLALLLIALYVIRG